MKKVVGAALDLDSRIKIEATIQEMQQVIEESKSWRACWDKFAQEARGVPPK